MSATDGYAPQRDPAVEALIRRALEEDLGEGDVTTRALVPATAIAEGVVVAREACVLAGLPVFERVLSEVDPRITCRAVRQDGEGAAAGERVLRVQGPAAGILTGERTALNFLQHLTGIATVTRRFVDAVAGTGAVVLDTRKTTPAWRALEKYAVRCGGGVNHRMGLYDRVLIKDNHRRLWAGGAGQGATRPRLDAAVDAARRACPGVPVEVEVETEAELESALRANPDWVLLDNMEPETLRRFAARCRGRCRVEASGGITLDNVRAVADTGVDAVSLGCLTHSAPAVDLSLEITA
ncbi:MAG: carboxylating nicotinate-nucleotide diphosphorylase [Lentisphaerae bacterium]|nr:carboxylating nicotinate-nucleotide diphosphorylase [Lentisphaerota bacterium]